MTILGKYTENEQEQVSDYKIPAVFKTNKTDMSLKKSILISTAIHPLTVFLIWLAIIVASLLGISFALFNKPEPKAQDIEFVLVDKEAKPINPKTRFRSDKNSRAGGKHDPKRKVSMPKAGGRGAPSKKQAQSQPKKAAQQPKSQKTPIPNKTKEAVKSKTQPTQTQAPAKAQAPSPAPRPSVTPTAPKITDKPKNNIVVPTPRTNIPKLGSPAGIGPIATPSGTGTGAGNKTGSNSGLSFAPAGGNGLSSGSSGRAGGSGSSTGNGRGTGRGTGTGAGNVGNPGPGNPKGSPGIDALKEPDFGPYMRDLQQKIKRNWEPPKGEESRRVVILFTIARDGRLLSKKIVKSSGLSTADRAAMSAVELSAPFKPLPVDYRESSVDIQFTFDYNVFSARKY